MATNGSIRIAVDAMGGDFAPDNEISGAILALKYLKGKNIEIVFLGDRESIENYLKKVDFQDKRISIVATDDVVTMHDDPVAAIKSKPNSSMVRAIHLLKNKEVDGFVSAGNTGAMLTTSTLLLGRIKGVSRPSIGTFMPTATNFPTLLMDAGATLDTQARFLYEYAIMGSMYFKEIFGIKKPTVGLLNVGEEPTKGTAELIETHRLLKNSNLNFIGNVEGRDILAGTANVVVCDGYTGNVILKFAESFLTIMKHAVKQFAEESFFNKLKAGFMLPSLRKVLSSFNYENYGGVPLLGVNGVVIIGHGSSSALAIKNMIIAAINTVENNICDKIESELINT